MPLCPALTAELWLDDKDVSLCFLSSLIQIPQNPHHPIWELTGKCRTTRASLVLFPFFVDMFASLLINSLKKEFKDLIECASCREDAARNLHPCGTDWSGLLFLFLTPVIFFLFYTFWKENGLLMDLGLFLQMEKVYVIVYGNLYRLRSEERRVGKECRSRWSADH